MHAILTYAIESLRATREAPQLEFKGARKILKPRTTTGLDPILTSAETSYSANNSEPPTLGKKERMVGK